MDIQSDVKREHRPLFQKLDNRAATGVRVHSPGIADLDGLVGGRRCAGLFLNDVYGCAARGDDS